MKKNIFLLIICSLFIFLSTTSGQIQDCNPSLAKDCNSPILGYVTITPNGFPNCSLRISYRYRVCNGKFELLKWNLAKIFSTNCNDFFTYIQNNLTTVTGFDQFWIDLDAQAFAAISNQIATGLVLNSGNPNLYSCESKIKAITIKYYRASCVSVWIGIDNDTEEFIAEQVPCEGSACCNLTSSSCFNPITGKMVTTITKEAQGTGLCGSKLPPPPLDGNAWFQQSPCLAFCNENDPISSKMQLITTLKGASDFNFSNPVNYEIQLNFVGNLNGTMEIYSMDGKMLKSFPVIDAQLNIDVSNLAKGMYLISWKNINNVISKKLIIE